MIRLSDADREAIQTHGASEFPRECCGVLFGDVENGVKFVTEVRALPNTFEPSAEFEQSVDLEPREGTVLHGQERRYMVSPDTMFQLMREERRTGRKVLGFYHSHPDHPARPSDYDRAWAMNWYTYIIVSILRGKPSEMTAWQLNENGDAFDSEQIGCSIS